MAGFLRSVIQRPIMNVLRFAKKKPRFLMYKLLCLLQIVGIDNYLIYTATVNSDLNIWSDVAFGVENNNINPDEMMLIPANCIVRDIFDEPQTNYTSTKIPPLDDNKTDKNLRESNFNASQESAFEAESVNIDPVFKAPLQTILGTDF